jgi:uncharacterized membrane protein YgcG
MFEFIKHITSTFKKRNALRKTKAKLRLRYGSTRYYTPGQIRTASEQAGIDQRYHVYGFALFLAKDEFESLGLEAPQGRNYEDLRSGIEDIGSVSSSKTSGGPGGDGGHGDGGGDGGGGGESGGG